MSGKVNFLFELGTEEIPAGYVPSSIKTFSELFRSSLDEKRISYSDINVLATPRRIAVQISDLSDKQKASTVEVKGPSAEKAYDAEGKPSKALMGFMRGNGFDESNLETVSTDKGDYVYGKKEAEVDTTDNLLPEIITDVIKKISFPKRMKWSTKEFTYPRPIRYIMTLFNGNVIPFEIDGIKSSNMTRGHYIQHPDMYEVKDPDSYSELLRSKAVILDQDERKQIIKEELQKAADKAGGVLISDEELLDTVTFLVEDPHVVICNFKKVFLKIPDIVLIAEMKEHQKYFAVRDKDGKLTDTFLVIANNPATEFIKEGNERVISARFSDAEFFYEEDRKCPLIDKVESLKTVVFHKDLGSIYDKMERVRKISSFIAENCGYDSELKNKIDRAVLLSKADLNTSMVFEFTSLQGQIGKIYAELDGEDKDVAAAIEDHYRPKFNGDDLPSSEISVTVSLAEKFDNIFGSYSVGNIPKGSQDPYALRRQAHAVADILIKNEIHLAIDEVFDYALSMYDGLQDYKSKIMDFFAARAKTLFLDEGIAYDEYDACAATKIYDYYELFMRANSLNEFRKNQSFSDMLAGFKRMNNILSAFLKKNKGYEFKEVSEKYFKNEEEKNLYSYFSGKSGEIENFLKDNNYSSLFNILIEGKEHIDSFFDKVMVMDEDESVRDNRLALLNSIASKFSSLMDFSKIADA